MLTRSRRLVLGLALLLALVPATLLANDRFLDVTDPLYHDAVNQLAASGITTGCFPSADPRFARFCPDDTVTRWQMALFLVRGLGLSGTPAPNTYVSKARTVDDFAITSTKVATGTLTPDRLNAAGSTAGQVLTSNGTSLLFQTPPEAWTLAGNAGTNPTVHFLGTTDGTTLTLRVSNTTALRVVPSTVTAGPVVPNLIGGALANQIPMTVSGGVIGGGGAAGSPNRVFGSFSQVGGGYGNTASADLATIDGGINNSASGLGYPTIGGGAQNTASGTGATIGGGFFNTVSGGGATVSGGQSNTASGDAATVGGGLHNVVTGTYATVVGGLDNTAGGFASVALGRGANANLSACFVFSSGSSSGPPCLEPNSAVFRVSNGFRIYTSALDGPWVAPGANAWTTISDRHVKANVVPVDGRAVLAGVARLPLSTWNYTSQDASIRHMGPMAQDFAAAFGVGEDERGISTVDADGVALAAIQGLHQVVEEKEARITGLEQQVAGLSQQNTAQRAELTDLQTRLAALEQLLQTSRVPSP